MKRQKMFYNYFEKPVIWLDEVEQPLIHASLGGDWVSESFLGSCVFHFDLQEDGKSVQVSISKESQEAMACQHTNLENWAEEALKTFIDNDFVSVVDRISHAPLKKNNSTLKI